MPSAVRCVTCQVELSLAGIDETHSGGAFKKALDAPLYSWVAGGMFPLMGLIVFKAVDAEQSSSELPCAETHVVAPKQFEAYRFCTFILILTISFRFRTKIGLAILKIEEGVVNLACGNATKG